MDGTLSSRGHHSPNGERHTVMTTLPRAWPCSRYKWPGTSLADALRSMTRSDFAGLGELLKGLKVLVALLEVSIRNV